MSTPTPIIKALRAERDRLQAERDELLTALRAAHRELRLNNLTNDGGQRPNTPAAAVIELARAAIAKAEAR